MLNVLLQIVKWTAKMYMMKETNVMKANTYEQKSLTLRKIFIQFHKKFDFETFTTKWMLQNLTFWIEILRFDKSLLNWPTSASQTLIVGEKYQNLSLADWGSKCLLLSGTPCRTRCSPLFFFWGYKCWSFGAFIYHS